MSCPLKVLYIDGVGPFGGASRSLFEAMRAMPEGSVERYFLVQKGTIIDFYGPLAAGVVAVRGLTRFDNTRASHYRGRRWIVVLRELFHFPFTIVGLLAARRRFPRIDVIHANEITEIIPGLLAKWLFKAPLVLHTRSLQRFDAKSRRVRWYHRMLSHHVDAVVAIDENVRETLPAGVSVDVIHNAFSPHYSAFPDETYLSPLRRLRPSALVVGFVGNLHKRKGLIELCHAARLVKDQGGDVQYIVVGGGTMPSSGLLHWALHLLGLAENVGDGLPAIIKGLGLADDFFLLGHTADIQRVYEHMDVLAFPSHYDAAGRPVFEAAFSGVPSIVAVADPKPDTVRHDLAAIAIPAPTPELIAGAIMTFERDRDRTKRMGRAAQALALENFVPAVNAAKLLAVYRREAGAIGRMVGE
jgi:glycosyltransferase involved in cell wall biosynthesis